MIRDYVTDDLGTELLAALFVQAGLEFIAEGKEVFVVGIVAFNSGNGENVVVDVDLVTKKFLVTTFEGGGQDGEFVH